MIVIDEPLLARTRLLPCRQCRKPAPSQASHTMAKGMGGGSRLDVLGNVLPLCFDCHTEHHAGRKPTRFALLCMAACDLDTSAEALELSLWEMMRAPKECSYKVGKDGRKRPLRPGRDLVDCVPSGPVMAGPDRGQPSLESLEDRGWEDC